LQLPLFKVLPCFDNAIKTAEDELNLKKTLFSKMGFKS